ncbi:hypothetical protein PIB30_068648 [Stylosanthes scabra]|uniref:Uncharacterized protein n=1 Tax=Stylosanthes scabra TaxID=79078 RepID=A0ABU6XLF7_9FABA|nr:hypothetical protein [Stylosanthes scabra]
MACYWVRSTLALVAMGFVPNNERRILRKNISDENYNFLDDARVGSSRVARFKCEFRTILAMLVFVAERPVVISNHQNKSPSFLPIWPNPPPPYFQGFSSTTKLALSKLLSVVSPSSSCLLFVGFIRGLKLKDLVGRVTQEGFGVYSFGYYTESTRGKGVRVLRFYIWVIYVLEKGLTC